MSNLILGYGLLGKEIHKQTGWPYIQRGEFTVGDCVLELERDSIDTIINCIGYTNTYDNDKKTHWESNIDMAKTLIDSCNESKRKYVHISTDYIYSGSEANASEEDVPVHNNCWYSYTKLVADALVQLESNNYLICRGTHKPYPFTHEKAWSNQFGNFDYVNVIAGLIIKLINKGATGIYNVGTGIKTMHDLAKKTRPDVMPCRKIQGAPGDVTMNIDKLKNLLK